MDKRILFILLGSFLTLLLINSIGVTPVNARQVCECSAWQVRRCDDGRTTGGCTGGNRNCNTGSYCRYCVRTECHDDSPRCSPTALVCNNICGQTSRCASDGCGGMTCCPATSACPTPTPPPRACIDSDGGSYPGTYGYVTISAPALPETKKDTCLVLETTAGSSRWVAQASGTHVGEKTCVNTATGSSADTVIACANGCADGACLATPRVYCSPTQRCPAGQECYQPPMPACLTGVCPQVMPAPYCQPSQCPKRHLGDANCDQLVNAADFEIFKSTVRGLRYASTNHSADFNADSKVNLQDYEIWRNTVYPLPGV